MVKKIKIHIAKKHIVVNVNQKTLQKKTQKG